jgi:hypothetical protein
MAVGNAATFLKEAHGLLWRFGRVYLGYTTQGDAGGALAGCNEPTVQVLLFPFTRAVTCRCTAASVAASP